MLWSDIMRGISTALRRECSEGDNKRDFRSIRLWSNSSLSIKFMRSLRNWMRAVKQISFESSSSLDTICSILKSRWKRISKSWTSTLETKSRWSRSFWTWIFFRPVSRCCKMNKSSMRLEFFREYSIMNFRFKRLWYRVENSLWANMVINSSRLMPLLWIIPNLRRESIFSWSCISVLHSMRFEMTSIILTAISHDFQTKCPPSTRREWFITMWFVSKRPQFFSPAYLNCSFSFNSSTSRAITLRIWLSCSWFTSFITLPIFLNSFTFKTKFLDTKDDSSTVMLFFNTF